ncbi:hypothetical protein V6380_11895 [Acinetobacter variabilis]|uniref:hypothetical protein n=1 Tax=Acinetobacter variabilis TaxID=70346 RepID=UPI003B84316E
MIIHFGPVGRDDGNYKPVIIDQLNTHFDLEGYKCAVFDKGGCGLLVKLPDNRTVTLYSQLGALFGEVIASKVEPIDCHSFSVFLNHDLVFMPSRITMDKAILSFYSDSMNFSIDLNKLNFGYDTFHSVIGSEIEASQKLSLKKIINGIKES